MDHPKLNLASTEIKEGTLDLEKPLNLLPRGTPLECTPLAGWSVEIFIA